MARGRNQGSDLSAGLRLAKVYAAEAHTDQMYGERPYIYHLEQVSTVLQRYRFTDPDLHAAAWLHDTVEDTDVTLEDLANAGFSQRTIFLVDCVTQRPGHNRRERAAATYPYTRRDTIAVALKLADRIANVEASIEEGKSGLTSMYRKEYPGFRQALYREGEWQEMWDDLDKLLL
jgi:(p)ppGpp synthase/HD superfamily hydrolase